MIFVLKAALVKKSLEHADTEKTKRHFIFTQTFALSVLLFFFLVE